MTMPVFRRLARLSKVEWCSRVVSTVHAAVVSLVTWRLILTVIWDGFDPDVFDVEWRSQCRLTILLALAYLTCDCLLTLMLLNEMEESYATLAHHVACIIPCALTMVFGGPMLAFWGMALLGTEVSTLWLNLVWFLGLGQNSIARHLRTLFGLGLVLTFFLFRIVFIPLWVFWILSSEALVSHGLLTSGALPFFRETVLVAMGSMLLYILNLHWFAVILRGAYAALKGEESVCGEDSGAIGQEREGRKAKAG